MAAPLVNHPAATPALSHRQRLLNQLRGAEVDRIPSIGGWNLGVRNLAALADLTVDDYLGDPLGGVIRANEMLGVDAIVSPIVPTDVDSIRSGALEEMNFAEIEPEALQERATQIPDTEKEVLASFDSVSAEKRYRDFIEPLLRQLGDIQLIANFWDAPANFPLYFSYGYEAFLAATALYPDAVEKIWWADGFIARERNKIIVRLMQEFDLLPILFTGHDICLNDGPMCSPEFLRQRYWAHAKVSLMPFVESGIRVVCHCDGNVMPLIDDMLAAGFSGFQGFQYECGADPVAIRQRDDGLLMFMGLSVSRTLAWGGPRDVEDEVDYFLDATDGGRGMFLFTSNVTGVEVPPANIRAAYQHLSRYNPRQPRPSRKACWPWAGKNDYRGAVAR